MSLHDFEVPVLNTNKYLAVVIVDIDLVLLEYLPVIEVSSD